MAQTVKNLPAVLETQVQSLSWEDPLEKGMATHSSILGIPRTKEPGGLQSMGGSQQTVENSERDGNTRPPDLPPEKSVCRSGSNS